MAISNCFIGCNKELKEAEIALIGLPYDGTSSYRPGSRFAPNAIREASYGLETYSPVFDADLEENISVCDTGDIELPFGDVKRTLSMIYEKTKSLSDKKVFAIGGEHLVTLPVFQALYDKFPELYVIHFDAHADLRDDYLGDTLSHATVIRRISDITGFGKIFQYGIRSGTKEEYQLIKKHNTLNRPIDDIKKIIGNAPVYLTVDLDVLDPSIFPGTGTPEPGGYTYIQLLEKIRNLHDMNIIGCDVVELSPHYDQSGVSTIVAAKIIRELFFILGKKNV
ncbi:agmatinase [Deferribacterales bacterium Es71-Z0220]|jgi:agmatinase|uniref:agmatinase n=1 Tax=Deferrivibrio essentukiensis TaxID=2880922 RepID=UPI001F60A841|nr:agmatinase [Deferrivibrio essentukiensis]MBZ4672171.1 speB [Deferribacteraceae bacterium]MCB4204930.1 agmatinase [Deferrivibrio essentukiensis]